MSNSEKKAYIDAELCIMSKPPKAGLRGAQTLFDEFQSLHAMQFELAHFVVRSLQFPPAPSTQSIY